jgi:hypothetical protein
MKIILNSQTLSNELNRDFSDPVIVGEDSVFLTDNIMEVVLILMEHKVDIMIIDLETLSHFGIKQVSDIKKKYNFKLIPYIKDETKTYKKKTIVESLFKGLRGKYYDKLEIVI